jgi:hypothetical protein
VDKFSKKEGSKIAELIEKGREQGFLTYDDVNDHSLMIFQILIKWKKLLE